MLFHIQATHSYEMCLTNDPEKKKILRDALKSAEHKGVKIHNLVSSRPAHTLWMIVEAETFEAIDEMFEPIRAMTDAVINGYDVTCELITPQRLAQFRVQGAEP